MEELSYVLTKDFVSCVHVCFCFFTAAHFHLAASISHFLTTAMKFSCFSSSEIRLPSSFSVIHMSVNIKNNVKKDTTLFYFLKVRAVMRFSSVAFGLPHLLIEFFYIGVPVVRTDGRSLGRWTVTLFPNFLGWVDLFSCGAPHARVSLALWAPL